MRLHDRFRRWRRQRRIHRAARDRREANLREFVYLDEISVFSLISSRLGSVATEFTATESRSLTDEITGATVASTGVIKGEVRAKTGATQTRGTQVLRKATVQATFRELHTCTEPDFGLHPTTKAPPLLHNARTLEVALMRAQDDGWAKPADQLSRGQLVEIEVTLKAEDVFRVGTVVDTFLELVRETPEILGFDAQAQLPAAIAASTILNKLLFGLIPIRGRAVNYATVDLGDCEWVVHRDVVEQLRHTWPIQSKAIDVVAVTDASLYWKDTRRVLFSDARYTLMCRIGRDGLHSSWTPVKLVDVVGGLLPDIAHTIGSAGENIAAGLTRRTTHGDESLECRSRMLTALESFGRNLCALYDKDWAPELVNDDSLTSDGAQDWEDLKKQRPPFEILTDQLRKLHNISPSHEQVASLRYKALCLAGLSPLGCDIHRDASTPPEQRPQDNARILDTELIAIYW